MNDHARADDRPKAPSQPATTAGTLAVEVLIDVREAARRLDVSERTLKRRIAAGVLPAVRVGNGRLVRVRPSDLEALLEPVRPSVTVPKAGQ